MPFVFTPRDEGGDVVRAAQAVFNRQETPGDEKMTEAAPAANEAGAKLLNRLLEACAKAQASDMHLSTGRVPYLRIEGEIIPQPQLGTLTAEGMESIVQAITADMDHGDALKRTGAVDGSYSLPEGPRFRFNLFRRQGVVVHRVPAVGGPIPLVGGIGTARDAVPLLRPPRRTGHRRRSRGRGEDDDDGDPP